MSKCQTSLEKLSEGRILSVFKLRHHSPIVIKYFSWSSSSSSSNEWHLKGSRRQMDLEVHRRTPACEIKSIFSFNFFIITINIITGSLSPSLNHFFCGFFSVKFVMISIYMKTCTLLYGLCHPSLLFWLHSRLVGWSVRATESLNLYKLGLWQAALSALCQCIDWLYMFYHTISFFSTTSLSVHWTLFTVQTTGWLVQTTQPTPMSTSELGP